MVEDIYIGVSLIMGIVTAVVYPLYSRTVRHELGHALEYFKVTGKPAIIHLPRNYIIPAEFSRYKRKGKCIFKKDLSQYLAEDSKMYCTGITEMPEKIPTEAVPRIAKAGAMNASRSVIRHFLWTVATQFLLRLMFIHILRMDPSVPPAACLFICIVFFWPLVDLVGYMSSGSDGGDKFFATNPQKWN